MCYLKGFFLHYKYARGVDTVVKISDDSGVHKLDEDLSDFDERIDFLKFNLNIITYSIPKPPEIRN